MGSTLLHSSITFTDHFRTVIWGDGSQMTVLKWSQQNILFCVFPLSCFWLAYLPTFHVNSLWEPWNIDFPFPPLLFSFMFLGQPLCPTFSCLSPESCRDYAGRRWVLWLPWAFLAAMSFSHLSHQFQKLLTLSWKECESDWKRTPESEDCPGLLHTVFALCFKPLPYSWIWLENICLLNKQQMFLQ